MIFIWNRNLDSTLNSTSSIILRHFFKTDIRTIVRRVKSAGTTNKNSTNAYFRCNKIVIKFSCRGLLMR